MDTPQETQNVEVIEAVQCNLCEDGVMRRAIIKPFNVNVGIILMVVGVFCLVTGLLALIGLVMLLLGGYFVLAKKEVWLCDRCESMVPRM